MSKGINHYGAYQQKMFLNAKLQEALKKYMEENDGKPFEFRHNGFLYPRVKTSYENMGFALTWHRANGKMYWSFMLPKDVKIDPKDLT